MIFIRSACLKAYVCVQVALLFACRFTGLTQTEVKWRFNPFLRSYVVLQSDVG